MVENNYQSLAECQEISSVLLVSLSTSGKKKKKTTFVEFSTNLSLLLRCAGVL